jgi:hypothetical protein
MLSIEIEESACSPAFLLGGDIDIEFETGDAGNWGAYGVLARSHDCGGQCEKMEKSKDEKPNR